MNKIFKLISTLILLLTLSGCVEEVEKFNVNFYDQDEIVHNIEVEKDSSIEPYELEERENYHYNWYLENEDQPFDFLNTKINSNINLYAKWEETVFYLTWEMHDQRIVTSYKEGSQIEVIDPSNKGYKFIGFEPAVPSVMPGEDLVIKANYEQELYNITFLDENDHVIDEVEVNYYEDIVKPEIQSREGFIHIWVLNDLEYDFKHRYEDKTVKIKYIERKDQYNLDVYYLNDTHGAVLNNGSELGLAKIANYIKNEYIENEDASIFITGGDIFQGQLISNHSKGQIMVEAFNEMKLDAFVIGNHEFDWGLEEVLKFFNPKYSGIRANFPILGANIRNLHDSSIPEFIDKYTIIERNGAKVGIIGVIGDGLESSISTLRVKDYYFSNAYQAVLETANEIKDLVDTILVVNHSADQSFNQRVGKIEKVSAIFNGHTHSDYTGHVYNENDLQIPYIQSGSNGEMVGKVSLLFDSYYNYVSGNAENIKYHSNLDVEDETVKTIINAYYEEIRHLYEEILLVAGGRMNKNDLAVYISKVMKEATNAVVGFQNSGGTRAEISSNQNITAADLFQIFPFDNQIIYTEVTGRDLKSLYKDSYLIKSNSLNLSTINDNELYVVATNDYIYYSSYQSYAFGNTTPLLYGDMYETFYEVMLNLKKEGYTHFDINSPIILGD